MNISTKSKIAAVLIPAAALLALAAPAFATTVSTGISATASGTSIGAKAQVKLSSLQAKAAAKSATEIGNRVTDLTSLITRINAATHVSAAVKTSLTATIQTDIASLTSLQAKIAADTTAADLKTDMASITQGYRIYALVVPQTRILVAADRETTINEMITALNAKLVSRITAATNAGKDTSTILAAQTDMTAKITDSNLQTSTAIAGVSGLVPDNGNATILASNNAALVKARADLRVSESDLKAAQKDVKTIVSALKGFGDVSASASTTVTQ